MRSRLNERSLLGVVDLWVPPFVGTFIVDVYEVKDPVQDLETGT